MDLRETRMQMWHSLFEISCTGNTDSEAVTYNELTSGKGQDGPSLGQVSRPPSTDTFRLRIRQGVTRAAEVFSFSATHCAKLLVSQANCGEDKHTRIHHIVNGQHFPDVKIKCEGGDHIHLTIQPNFTKSEELVSGFRPLNVRALASTYHINKGRDEDEDNGEYSDQCAVGARLDNLLWNSLHCSWKELQEKKKRFKQETDCECMDVLRKGSVCVLPWCTNIWHRWKGCWQVWWRYWCKFPAWQGCCKEA